MSEIDMNTQSTPETDALLADAARADLAFDERGNAFRKAAQELVSVQRRIAVYIKSHAAWLDACDEHGGPDEALAAAQVELEQARERLARLKTGHTEVQKLRNRLDDALRAVRARLFGLDMELIQREQTLAAQLKGVEAAREANIAAMVKLGADEATARSVAKPNLGEIATLRVELAGIPELKAENARLIASHVEQAKLACAEA